MLQTLDATATAARLPYVALADAIAQVLRDARAGRAQAPARLVMPVPGPGSLLLMPASNAEIAITKMITVHPHNAAHGLPAIHGEVVVMDAATGVRRLLLDGPTVTAHRTAAVSPRCWRAAAGAGARRRPAADRGRGRRRARIWKRSAWGSARGASRVTRTEANAEALAAHARKLGLEATAVAAGDAAGMAQAARIVLPYAPLVITATPSIQPVLPDLAESGTAGVGQVWRAQHFIAAVGAFRPEMAELPPRLCMQAAASDRLFADTLTDLDAEAGDLLQAGVPWSCVRPLQQCIDAAPDIGAQAAPGVPVVFKSVGSALWDLAACALALSKAPPV
ncbi:ornithine cyclodeaminase [Ralstonia solanacearum]|nr:ornithine cyclodeaminase [Ralstonia solanacearum]